MDSSLPVNVQFTFDREEEFTINQIRADFGLDPIVGCDEVWIRNSKGIFPKDDEQLYRELLDKED